MNYQFRRWIPEALWALGVLSILLSALILGVVFFIVTQYQVDLSPLARYSPGKPSIVLDQTGVEWTRFALDKRHPLMLSQIPMHVQHAFIAAEDWHFFEHNGISWRGIFRSTIVNVVSGKKMQGASTITQQLVKLLFFNSQKTFRRKIKEQLYAILVERQFTKEQILEIYLNHIYFGCGVYGVEAASQRFWGVPVRDLTIDQAATLAAIIRSPKQYNPIFNPANTLRRRNIIVHNMHKLGLITREQYDTAKAAPIQVRPAEQETKAPHAREYLRLLLEQEVGKDQLYSGGLLIQTTLDLSMQEKAQKSFMATMHELKQSHGADIDGALMSIDVASGAIRAMIGGFDFNQSKFNRAVQAKRQIGSIIKPLIYAAAVSHGIPLYSISVDEPIRIEQYGQVWQPNNYDDKFEGSMTLARALIRSNNIIAIKTLLRVGPEAVAGLAQDCGLGQSIPAYPSLALGCIDATLLQAAGMFNIFANHGTFVKPHLISWVKDSWGTKIIKHSQEDRLILPAWIADTVSKILENGMRRWRTLYNKEFVSGDIIQKTGTTNDNRTCWYAGSSPEITTVVYVGCDNNRPLPAAYPVKTAFPIWQGLHEQYPVAKPFGHDPRLRSISIHQWTGAPVSPHDPEALEIVI